MKRWVTPENNEDLLILLSRVMKVVSIFDLKTQILLDFYLTGCPIIVATPLDFGIGMKTGWRDQIVMEKDLDIGPWLRFKGFCVPLHKDKFNHKRDSFHSMEF